VVRIARSAGGSSDILTFFMAGNHLFFLDDLMALSGTVTRLIIEDGCASVCPLSTGIWQVKAEFGGRYTRAKSEIVAPVTPRIVSRGWAAQAHALAAKRPGQG